MQLTTPSQYEQALSHLNSTIELSGQRTEWSLDDIANALQYAGLNPRRIESLQVVGTNGKGTTARCIAGIVSQHGFRVGLYTSPHLVTVRERIQINGEMISAEDFGRLYVESIAIFEKFKLSYFEKLTFLAVRYFLAMGVDFVVYETGLGGRLDAVTALQNRIAVFTSISIDHTEFLGESLAEIATDKAAVLRYCDFALSVKQVSAVQKILEDVAKIEGKPIVFSEGGNDITFTKRGMDFSLAGHSFSLPMFGVHFVDDAVLAIEASRHWLGKNFCYENARLALAGTRWQGRLEIREWQRRQIVFSCAHNEASVSADIAAIVQLIAHGIITPPVHVLFTATRNRPAQKLLDLIAPHFPSITMTRVAPHPRPQDPRDFPFIEDPLRAFEHLSQCAPPGETILIIGSIYLCGIVLEKFSCNSGWECV